jgi:hypothetical protein
MFVSDNWKTLLNTLQIAGEHNIFLEQWVFFEINLTHRRILKLNYVGNIIE